MTSEELKDRICKVLDDKKAENIKVLNVGEQTILADYFIICNTRSVTQVKSISENLVDIISEEDGIKPIHSEGMRGGKWALIDFDSVIVHIFESSTRTYYSLETLWGNGSNSSDFPKE